MRQQYRRHTEEARHLPSYQIHVKFIGHDLILSLRHQTLPPLLKSWQTVFCEPRARAVRHEIGTQTQFNNFRNGSHPQELAAYLEQIAITSQGK